MASLLNINCSSTLSGQDDNPSPVRSNYKVRNGAKWKSVPLESGDVSRVCDQLLDSTVHNSTLLGSTKRRRMLYSTVRRRMLYSTMLYWSLTHSTVQYCAVLICELWFEYGLECDNCECIGS
jgi:hypothetical protein